MRIGFLGLLTIVFIVLKLTGVISWSWVWVLSPLWISFVLWVFVVFILGLIMSGAYDALVTKWKMLTK